MSNQSARSFRTEGALRRARVEASHFAPRTSCGYLSLAFLPEPQPLPLVASVVHKELSLPRYPGVLARTFEGGLCFAHPVPVVYLRGPSLLGC